MSTSKVFISYSWDSEQHKLWVRNLATRLRKDGVEVSLDQWDVVPGDQLSEFMERATRENDFVLIVCTPRYKEKSDKRVGGVGHEGNVMTAEVLTKGNDRKFIPVLRQGEWNLAAPTWLLGKYYIDLKGEKMPEGSYKDLLDTLLGQRPQAPPLGPPRQQNETGKQGSSPLHRNLENSLYASGQPVVLGECDSDIFAIAFSPDGRTIALGGSDNSVRTWDIQSGSMRLLGWRNNPITSVVFSPQGRSIATATTNEDLSIWDVNTGEVSALSKLPEGYQKYKKGYQGYGEKHYYPLAFSPDGKNIICGASFNERGCVLLRKIDKMHSVLTRFFSGDNARYIQPYGHDWGELYSLAFSPDGESIVSGDSRGAFIIRGLKSVLGIKGETTTRILEGNAIHSAAFSSNGDYIVMAGRGLYTWHVQTGVLRVLQGYDSHHGDSHYAIASFSQDCKTVASVGIGGKVTVCEIPFDSNKIQKQTIDEVGYTSYPCIAFAPDGRSIAYVKGRFLCSYKIRP